MTTLSAVVIATAALVIGASAHAEGAKVIRTQFFFASIFSISGSGSYEALVTGVVESSRRKCTQGRKVILYFKRGRHKRHLRDVGRSSRNGAVGLEGRSRGEPERLIVRVTKRRVANHGHPYVCWPDHAAFNLRRFKSAGETKQRFSFPLPR
jgi:hypothetical protein